MNTATKAFLADSVATLLINGSFSIQKLGHRDVENSKQGSRAHLTSKTWWLGFCVMVCGVTIHICALPYVDLTLLAANASLAIVGNLFLSMWLFDEEWVWKYDLTAVVLIISGCITIAAMSNKEQKELKPEEMFALLRSWQAIIFYTFVFLFTIVTYYAMHVFERALRTFETDADL